jgi:hypothetical protein
MLTLSTQVGLGVELFDNITTTVTYLATKAGYTSDRSSSPELFADVSAWAASPMAAFCGGSQHRISIDHLPAPTITNLLENNGDEADDAVDPVAVATNFFQSSAGAGFAIPLPQSETSGGDGGNGGDAKAWRWVAARPATAMDQLDGSEEAEARPTWKLYEVVAEAGHPPMASQPSLGATAALGDVTAASGTAVFQANALAEELFGAAQGVNSARRLARMWRVTISPSAAALAPDAVAAT